MWLMSTSLKVVRMAAVCCASTRRSAMRRRSGDIGTTSSTGSAAAGLVATSLVLLAWLAGCENSAAAGSIPCSRRHCRCAGLLVMRGGSAGAL
jgi:hypothetical protein